MNAEGDHDITKTLYRAPVYFYIVLLNIVYIYTHYTHGFVPNA